MNFFRTFVLAFSSVAVIGSPGVASTLTALPTGKIQDLPSFTIEFTDFNRDGLLSLEEIDSFSGFTVIYEGTFPGTHAFKKVAQVPGLENISSPTADFAYDQFIWEFNVAEGERFDDVDFGYYANAWTYDLKLDVPAVPLPAGGALLIGALGALALVRRRRL